MKLELSAGSSICRVVNAEGLATDTSRSLGGQSLRELRIAARTTGKPDFRWINFCGPTRENQDSNEPIQ